MPADQSAANTMMRSLRSEIVGVDQQVPVLDGTFRTYVNLDNAASTPAFVSVQQKVDEALTWYSSVHRGSGFKSLVSSEAYDVSREIVADFLGADRERDAVIYGKNTSEALNLLANSFDWHPGDIVVSTLMEHHSDDLPWRAKAEVVRIGVLDDGSLDTEEMHRQIMRHAGHIRLVGVTGASNVTGYTPPIHQIAEWAHEAGALMLVDAAQLAPHRKLDMQPYGAPGHLDFVTISAHKMYAPFGTGVLVGPKEFFNRFPPLYRGGGTIEIVSTDEVFWADAPERGEAGSPNVIGAIALAASIRKLNEIGMDVLAAHEQHLTQYALEKLTRLDGVMLYGSADPNRLDDRLGVISFGLPPMSHGKVAAILGFEGAVGVRNGCFCAHPYILKLMGVNHEEYELHKADVLNHDRSTLPGLVRASFGCYTEESDIDALVATLERILAGDYKGEYVLDARAGAYYPRNYDHRLLGRVFQL
jgi:cysteine desulfurase / selenocysteine lyase